MSNTLLADAEFTCLTYGSFLFGQIFAIFDFFFQSFWSVFTLQSILQGYFTNKNGKKLGKDDENIVHKLMDYRSKINETDEFDQS